MSGSVNQDVILQAIKELSSLVKDLSETVDSNTTKLNDLSETVESNHEKVMERIDSAEENLSEKIRKVDDKVKILTNELLDTKAGSSVATIEITRCQ